MRRNAQSAAPEPCRLPAAAIDVRAPGAERPGVSAAYRIGPWETTWDPREYADAVEAVRQAIAAGDVTRSTSSSISMLNSRAIPRPSPTGWHRSAHSTVGR